MRSKEGMVGGLQRPEAHRVQRSDVTLLAFAKKPERLTGILAVTC